MSNDEPAAPDAVKAQAPDVVKGSTVAQLFIGCKSLVSNGCGITSEAAFINALGFEDNTHFRGSIDKFIANGATMELSDHVNHLLCDPIINEQHSEVRCQHQKFAKHWWRHIKYNLEWFMNQQGCPLMHGHWLSSMFEPS